MSAITRPITPGRSAVTCSSLLPGLRSREGTPSHRIVLLEDSYSLFALMTFNETEFADFIPHVNTFCRIPLLAPTPEVGKRGKKERNYVLPSFPFLLVSRLSRRQRDRNLARLAGDSEPLVPPSLQNESVTTALRFPTSHPFFFKLRGSTPTVSPKRAVPFV